MTVFIKWLLAKDMVTQMVVYLINPYFKKFCKRIALDLSKQQALDTGPKWTQQITFTGNLDWAATMF